MEGVRREGRADLDPEVALSPPIAFTLTEVDLLSIVLNGASSELVPMIRDCSVTISMVPTGESDIKFALELGLSIMMDKPIIAVVQPGSKVPAKLLLVADRIVEGDFDDPQGTAQRIAEAVQDHAGGDDV